MEKLKLAVLLENFSVTIPVYARLTDKQIVEGYFYPRDKHGQLKTPIAPVTEVPSLPPLTTEETLAKVDFLKKLLGGNDPRANASFDAAQQKLAERLAKEQEVKNIDGNS